MGLPPRSVAADADVLGVRIGVDAGHAPPGEGAVGDPRVAGGAAELVDPDLAEAVLGGAREQDGASAVAELSARDGGVVGAEAVVADRAELTVVEDLEPARAAAACDAQIALGDQRVAL